MQARSCDAPRAPPDSWKFARANPACPAYAAFNRFRFDISDSDVGEVSHDWSDGSLSDKERDVKEQNSSNSVDSCSSDGESLSGSAGEKSSLAFENVTLPQFDDSDDAESSDDDGNLASDAVTGRFLSQCTLACVVVTPSPSASIASAVEYLRRRYDKGRRCLVIATNDTSAKQLVSEIAAAIDEVRITYVPSKNISGRRAALQYLSKARRPGVLVAAVAALHSHSHEFDAALAQATAEHWDFAFIVPSRERCEAIRDVEGSLTQKQVLKALTGFEAPRPLHGFVQARSWVALVDLQNFDGDHPAIERKLICRNILSMLLGTGRKETLVSIASATDMQDDLEHLVLNLSDKQIAQTEICDGTSCEPPVAKESPDSRDDGTLYLGNYREALDCIPCRHENIPATSAGKARTKRTPRRLAMGSAARHASKSSPAGVVDTDDELNSLVRKSTPRDRNVYRQELNKKTSPTGTHTSARRRITNLENIANPSSRARPSMLDQTHPRRHFVADTEIEASRDRSVPIIILSDSSSDEAGMDSDSAQANGKREKCKQVSMRVEGRVRKNLILSLRDKNSSCFDSPFTQGTAIKSPLRRAVPSQKDTKSEHRRKESLSRIISNSVSTRSIGKPIERVSEIDRTRYNRMLEQAQRLEKGSDLVNALDLYIKCMEITDGDHSLQLRVVALGLATGVLHDSDFEDCQLQMEAHDPSVRTETDERVARKPVEDVIVLD